jgi:hypothetical protein
MLNRQTLDPEKRVLYGDSLRPPTGYVFDAAVATTFSLEFETALAASVSLALFAAENRDDLLSQPLALLEGAERIADRLVIFTDAGHIHAQSQPQSRLCSLLERMIVEVAAPQKGAFHPKIWVLRFRPMRPEDRALIRLLVMSRNLTHDRSWDISLRLDGAITGRSRSLNRPIVDFVKRLPRLAVSGISQDARQLTNQLAEDLRYADWEVPEPFESVAFAVNGLGGRVWKPAPCRKLGVISPFCDDAALQMLALLPSDEKPILIGRSDELAAISKVTLARFERLAVLDEMAATEDGEELPAETLQGLHAKAFISEASWNTTITIGSGNATQPALLSGRNVELFATLSGKRSRVGSVDDIMGPRGFGRLTRPFDPGDPVAIDSDIRAAEARIDDARRSLSGGGLRLRCERMDADETGETPWRVWLRPAKSLSLAGIGALSVWPITRGEDHGQDALDDLRQGRPVDLGVMPLIDLTRFLACRLSDATDKASALFSIGLVIEGLPANRHAAILRSIINSRDAFFRYLRLLLSELGDPFGAAFAAQESASHGSWAVAADDAPLLEEMVRAFCRGGDRLNAIERLITRLESGDETGPDPVPDDFRTLWESFRIALKDREPVDAD